MFDPQKGNLTQLALDIKAWGKELGFQEVAISDTQLSDPDQKLQIWLSKNWHGSMSYLERNCDKRSQPSQLIPGTIRIITTRMNYLPPNSNIKSTLSDKNKAYISRYALGRDYHKVIRKRLIKLAQKITEKIGFFNYRAFTDSAPVFEKPLAAKSGLGWMGKNTLILNREAGSWFFLGELYVDLPLPIDAPVDNHCGSCTACIDICPTQAIVGPYQLDARRCISYLTIENKGSIPIEFRPMIGNRVFGCDDCQLICPWNKFAKITAEDDFKPRHGLDNVKLTELFAWSEEEYLKKTEGSALRRAGYEGWLRNIAVGLGNSYNKSETSTSTEALGALKSKENHPSEMVREHVAWAIKRIDELDEL